MGSTKKQIFCLLMGEGLLLLTLVALPAMIVCYNVGIAEFTMGHTELITTWPVELELPAFPAGLVGCMAADSADGGDWNMVPGTAGYQDTAGRGIARRIECETK